MDDGCLPVMAMLLRLVVGSSFPLLVEASCTRKLAALGHSSGKASLGMPQVGPSVVRCDPYSSARKNILHGDGCVILMMMMMMSMVLLLLLIMVMPISEPFAGALPVHHHGKTGPREFVEIWHRVVGASSCCRRAGADWHRLANPCSQRRRCWAMR